MRLLRSTFDIIHVLFDLLCYFLLLIKSFSIHEISEYLLDSVSIRY